MEWFLLEFLKFLLLELNSREFSSMHVQSELVLSVYQVFFYTCPCVLVWYIWVHVPVYLFGIFGYMYMCTYQVLWGA